MSGKVQRGAAVVEFAIVLPLLLLVLFGIIEFGFIMYDKHIITNASREGARYGIVVDVPRRGAELIRLEVLKWISLTDDNPTGDKNRLISFGDDRLQNNDDDITVRIQKNGETGWNEFDPDNPPKFGDKLKVTINYKYGVLFIPKLAWDLTSETVMNYE